MVEGANSGLSWAPAFVHQEYLELFSNQDSFIAVTCTVTFFPLFWIFDCDGQLTATSLLIMSAIQFNYIMNSFKFCFVFLTVVVYR